LALIESDEPINIDKVNRLLPEDIVLWASTEVQPGFKPRFDVLMRHYRYYMAVDEKELDFFSMRKAVESLIGSHDFSILSKPDGDRETSTTILNIYFHTNRNNIVFDVFGTNFLWKLVRKIITLLMEIGINKYDYTLATELIENRHSTRGGISPAPPEGLILIEAVVPFRMKQSKYAIRRIRKELEERSTTMTRMITTLTSLTTDFLSDRRSLF
jgi:tRNA pseudouridine38-40 synthase